MTRIAASPASTLQTDALMFPDGLVGCQDWRNFVLLTDDQEELPVAYLQSLDEPQVRLLITDPRLIESGYAAPLTDTDKASLDLDTSDTTVTYCTLTVANSGEITANLLGPLVINPRTRRGRQLVLTESGYSTRHPVNSQQEA